MQHVDKEIFDWTASGRTDIFSVQLCDRLDSGSIVEIGKLTDVTGCEIVWNDNTTLKESGKILHVTDWSDYRDKLVRIYQTSTLGSKRTRVLWGTYKISSDAESYDDTVQEIETELSSVLWYLEAAKTQYTLQVKRGTNILFYVRKICDDNDVKCAEVYDDVILSKDMTFQPGTPYISVINELLDTAGYFSARADEYGVVQFGKYVEPQSRPLAYTYTDESNSVLFNQQSNNKNIDDVPNVVVMIYENEYTTIVGIAKDKNSLSPTSITTRGYEVTQSETVADIATNDASDLEIQNALDALAKQTLDNAKSDYETWRLASTFTPISIRDTIRATTRNGKTFDYTVKTITRTMQPGVMQSMSVRKFEQ